MGLALNAGRQRSADSWLASLRANVFNYERRSWRQALIIGGTLGLSAFMAPRASMSQVAAIVGAILLAIVLRWPGLGVLALVAAANVVPFGLGTGTQTELNIAVLLVALLAVIWVLEMALRRDVRLLPSAALGPLAVFCVVSVLAFLIGLQPWLPLGQTAPLATQAGGLALVLLSFAAFLLTAHRLRDERWLQVLTWLFLLIGGAFMLVRLAAAVAGLPQVGSFRADALFARASDGSMFWLWIVALSFSQALANRKLARHWRAALFALGCLTIYLGLRNNFWSSGYMPGLVAFGVILLLAAPRLALVAVPIALAGVLYKLQSILDQFVFNDYKQYDLLTRVEAWKVLLQIIQIEPVLGTGFANYYWYTPLYSLLGYNVRFNSHNNYVDLTAETGVVGLACFLWFMLTLGAIAWRLRRRAPEGFSRAYCYGVLGGLAGMLVAAFMGDWVLPFVYNVGFAGFRASVLVWIFLGGLLVVERLHGAPVELTGRR
jgi:O-antigen ligase